MSLHPQRNERGAAQLLFPRGFGAVFFGRGLQEPQLPLLAIGVREVALKPHGAEWRGTAQKTRVNPSDF